MAGRALRNAVIRGFGNAALTERMMRQMDTLIDAWDPESSRHSIFHVNNAGGSEALEGSEAAAVARDTYFFASADQISFFLEPGAVDASSGDIRSDLPKRQLLNKVGSEGAHFDGDDEEILGSVLKLAALAIENNQLCRDYLLLVKQMEAQ